MLDSRDNSVLKSLKELRKQEEERVKKERAEADARADAERKAKEDAERKAKEDVERAKREEEDRVRRIQEEKEAREREERIRIEESERRARIEAETQLQQERMRLDAQVKSATKAKGIPVGAIVGIIAVVLVIAGGIIFKIKSDHEKQLAAEQEARAKESEAARLREAELEKKFELTIGSLNKQIAEAKSETERAALQKQLDEARANRAHATGGGSNRAAASKDKGDKGKESSAPAPVLIKSKKSVSDDPLDGLKL